MEMSTPNSEADPEAEMGLLHSHLNTGAIFLGSFIHKILVLQPSCQNPGSVPETDEIIDHNATGA